jgi:pyruvate dehydrogenase E1 component
VKDHDLETLESIQKRVLWLSTLIVHHANNVRPNPDKNKVGGHQASSASMVTILTALYFRFLKAGDRVSVKPHASPAYHAVQYLLGNLDQKYLTELRAFKGLQAYPSRTKDHDPVDFSTGSVGLGVTAPAFAALAHRYAKDQFGQVSSNRFIALAGDAELDEGSVWEAVNEEALRGLDNIVWIVDLNRQSLDRVVPGIKAAQLKKQFEVSGWKVLEAKYGSKLQAMFAKPGGERLRTLIDELSNEEYQGNLRLDGTQLRPRLLARDLALEELLAEVSDEDLPGLYSNLGGHDLPELLGVLEEADAVKGQPVIVFAYTVKGWNLPIAGDRLNHSALLTPEQIELVRQKFGIEEAHQWDAFTPDSPEGKLCREARERLYAPPPFQPQLVSPDLIPAELEPEQLPGTSTQEAFGRIMRRLADVPEVGQRLVTTSPDVSISTNLAGWINRVGVYHHEERPDYEPEAARMLKWQSTPAGRHIELGISEMNLFMTLAMFGLSAELSGQMLFPVGTVYDPFVCRGLDALIYALYSNSRMLFAGTPSGVTLSPEGGAHQSSITASIGMELPRLNYFEPCFSQELQWIMLEGLRQCCDRKDGFSTYLRLTTKSVDQTLLNPAMERYGREELRRQVLMGGYRLVDHRYDAPELNGEYVVQIATCGALVPEAVEAARLLHREGIAANVLNLTSPQKLHREWTVARRQQSGKVTGVHLQTLIPEPEQHAPFVTVHDAASHALSWLGSVYGAWVTALGVDDFGQSGPRGELYRNFGLDAESIASAAYAFFD